MDLLRSAADREAGRKTVLTRFLPARTPGQGAGTWKRYYGRWASMTIEYIGPEAIELLPPLAAYCHRAQQVEMLGDGSFELDLMSFGV